MGEIGFFEGTGGAPVPAIRVHPRGDGIRYVLPRRHDAVRLTFAGIMLVGGSLVGACGAAGAAIVWHLVRPQDSLPRAILTACLAAPLALLVFKGAWTVLKGVLMAVGHAEVVLSSKRMCAIERAGPIVRRESRPARCLRRLVVVDKFTIPGTRMSARGRADNHEEAKAAAVRVDCNGAAPVIIACDYPPNWLRALAGDLAARWEQLARIAPGGGELPALEVIDGTLPGAIASPADQPRRARGTTASEAELTAESLSCQRNLSFQTRHRIWSELARGERVVWIGHPRPRLRDSLAIVLIGLFCAGMGVTSASFMLSDPPDAGPMRVAFAVLSLIFLVPLVLLAVFLLAFPALKILEARRTYYVVTDLRAIVFAPRLFHRYEVASFSAEQLRGMTCTEQTDGSGHLLFRGGSPRPERDDPAERGFLCLRQVRPMERLVRKTLLEP